LKYKHGIILCREVVSVCWRMMWNP